MSDRDMNAEAAKNLVIDESNFNDYFFDVRTHGPKPGQVMASYTTMAELLDGMEKRQIMELLRTSDKMPVVVQIMKKALLAKDPDCYRVPREMAEDLLKAKNIENIAKKPYKYTMEMCFWVRPEYIPENDPHWACISILNLDDYLAKKDGITIESRIVEDGEKGGSVAEELGV